MRIVWAAFVAALLLGIGRSPLVAAMAQQSGPVHHGLAVTDRDFVYSPKPTPLVVSDPKFHREGFQVSAASSAAAGPPPIQAAVATATPVPVAPSPTVPSPNAPVVFAPTAVPIAPAVSATKTPFVVVSDTKPLYQPTPYDFRADTIAAPPGAFSGAAPTPTQVAAAPVRIVESRPAATATPSPAPMPQPTLVVVEPFDGGVDIEDPRFYRGSFTIAPGSSLQGNASSASAKAAARVPAAGYSGYSADTIVPSYVERTPLPVGGKAMYYNPGIMQEVYAYRLQAGQVQPCAECVGFVALLRKGDLNRRVWLQWGSGVVEGPFLVIDVAARQHIGLLLGRGWAVDVDYRTAMRHGMAGPVPVTILDSPAHAK